MALFLSQQNCQRCQLKEYDLHHHIGSYASHEHETHTKEEKETQEQIKKIGSDIIDAEKDTHDDHSTHEHGAPKQEVKTND